MNNALNNWLKKRTNDLKDQGIAISSVDGLQPDSYGVNLDSEYFVGGIFYWPKDIYEAQFNDCSSGEVVILETMNFNEPKLLEEYLDRLMFEKLLEIKKGNNNKL